MDDDKPTTPETTLAGRPVLRLSVPRPPKAPPPVAANRKAVAAPHPPPADKKAGAAKQGEGKKGKAGAADQKAGAKQPKPPPPPPRTSEEAGDQLSEWLGQQSAVWKGFLPLDLNTRQEVCTLLDAHGLRDAYSKQAIHKALRWHTIQQTYLENILGHPNRYRLDGQIGSEVTQQQRDHAQQGLDVQMAGVAAIRAARAAEKEERRKKRQGTEDARTDGGE